MPKISRQPLRSQIRRHLVKRLISGELKPGTQLNESELTEELGVSRTPLREALLQLEFEGLVESTPGKGFSVAPLKLEEVDELFDVGIELETLALEQSNGVPEEQREKLREINEERKRVLRGNGDRDRLVDLDDRWHRLLVVNCDNSQLLQLLRLVRNRLYRYIFAFEGHAEEVERAIEDHDQIVLALDRGDLDAAVERLRKHWKDGKDTMHRLMAASS